MRSQKVETVPERRLDLRGNPRAKDEAREKVIGYVDGLRRIRVWR
ncbi:hypothetical protein [Sulfurimonas sp. HSL-1716]